MTSQANNNTRQTRKTTWPKYKFGTIIQDGIMEELIKDKAIK